MNVVQLIHEIWPDVSRLLFWLIIVWGIRGCFLAIAWGQRKRGCL